MSGRALSYDVVVIGAGVAGLTAATRLAQSGATVCVLAKGVGSTHLAPGTVDVLGYAPERVQEPLRALPEFIAARPDHPYALIGVDAIVRGLEWWRGLMQAAGHVYVGGVERNLMLPSAVGALRPSALVPESMAGGDAGVAAPAPVCIVGVERLRDFHAALCAANLTRAGVPARAVTVDLDVGGPTANAVGLARQFDDRSFRIEAARRIGAAAGLREGERVGLPAVLGTRDASAAWREISERLERSVFEIPTLPPSAAGVRVYDALSRALRSAGGRIVLGAEVIDCTREGERVAAVLTRASGHHVAYRAGWMVLATGGFGSGAIELGSDWEVRERVLGLPLAGVPAAGAPRFTGSYFDSHPLSRVGVAVDSSLIASGTSNVLVAGAALPGAEPWREKSGEGIAVATGCFVADVVAHGVAEVAR